MSERTLILGGEVIDQSGRRRADVAIADGRIVAVGAGLSPAESDRRRPLPPDVLATPGQEVEVETGKSRPVRTKRVISKTETPA